MRLTIATGRDHHGPFRGRDLARDGLTRHLRDLARDVALAVDEVWPDGPQDRKAFRPHLTLARIQSQCLSSPSRYREIGLIVRPLDIESRTQPVIPADVIAAQECAVAREAD